MAQTLQQLWDSLNHSVLAAAVPKPHGTHSIQAASAPDAGSEDPPSLLLDYTAAEFIAHWMEKSYSTKNTYLALNTLRTLNLREPNPNPSLRLVSEGDAVRATHQYILNVVEPAANAIIQQIGTLLGKEFVLSSKADVDLSRGKVDLVWSMHERATPHQTRDVLYMEFNKANTLLQDSWRSNCFDPDPQHPFGYANWLQLKKTTNLPPNVRNHPKYDIQPDEIQTNWVNEGNAWHIARQANNYFVRGPFYNGPRVPLVIASDFRSVLMLDYRRTISENNFGDPLTSQSQAKEDKKRVGFCFLSEGNQPSTVKVANSTVTANATFRLFMVAAIYAGAYEAMGWTF